MDPQIQSTEASPAEETSTIESQTPEVANTVNAAENPATEKATGLSSIKDKIAKAQSEGGVIDPAKVIEAYTPNYKFKAMGTEQEFDELLRPLIKDKATEEKIRELYAKSYGIDSIKTDRQKYKEELDSLRPQYTSLNKGLDQLSGMLQKGDYHGFFNALKIPEQDVLQYALSRVQYKELPPEQQQQVDRQYQESQKLAYLEQTNQQILEMYQNQAVSQRTNDLDGFLGKPDVSSLASSFDARVGQPGAFRDEVIKRGQYYASLPNPVDIPVEQAVREVMTLIGQAQPAAPQVPQATAAIQNQVAAQQAKPVIPNIKGRGTSPTKKAVGSMKDLRRLAADFTE